MSKENKWPLLWRLFGKKKQAQEKPVEKSVVSEKPVESQYTLSDLIDECSKLVTPEPVLGTVRYDGYGYTNVYRNPDGTGLVFALCHHKNRTMPNYVMLQVWIGGSDVENFTFGESENPKEYKKAVKLLETLRTMADKWKKHENEQLRQKAQQNINTAVLTVRGMRK